MSEEVQQAEHDSPTSGFLQMSLAVLKAIADKGGSYKDLAAYIVLCAGVSGRHGRYCTHGAKSIRDRTDMSYRAAENALEWLHENGFIHPPGEGESKFLGKGQSRAMMVRWVLADGHDLDVAVSRQFIEGIKGHPNKQPLRKMLADIDGNGHSITRGQAITDAIILYAALMKEQDFDGWGGVDPSAWRQQFEPDHENGYITEMPGSNGVMVTVKESEQTFSTRKFIEKVMGPMPEDEVGSDLVRERFWSAARTLNNLRLTYRVLMLWQGDPLDPKTSRHAAPIATQYINDSWARKLDPHLQYEVNLAAWRTGARDAYSDFGEARMTGSLPFTGSGSYRYMVRAGAEKNCSLLGQLRVRYWPKTADVVQARLVEKRRTEKFSAAIQLIKNPF